MSSPPLPLPRPTCHAGGVWSEVASANLRTETGSRDPGIDLKYTVTLPALATATGIYGGERVGPWHEIGLL
jgi:hypothetical protein